MDSFEGSRRREGRSSSTQPERRSPREPEPLDQRLDRWMITGRQLVEGVSGGRPGSRPSSRRPEGRSGAKGGFDGLGRWVEDRLDWLLDDSDDWREPWQESERRRDDPPPPQERRRAAMPAPAPIRTPLAASPLAADPLPQSQAGTGSRRPLEAISRRSRPAAAANRPPAPANATEEWPDDDAFSLPRWQRPAASLRRPDPLQTELEERRRPEPSGEDAQAAQPGRPLPRSSRRR